MEVDETGSRYVARELVKQYRKHRRTILLCAGNRAMKSLNFRSKFREPSGREQFRMPRMKNSNFHLQGGLQLFCCSIPQGTVKMSTRENLRMLENFSLFDELLEN